MLQNWVKEKILKKFPTLTIDDVRSTSMGNGGEDVQLSAAAREIFPYTVECKNNARIAVYKFYEQAQAHGRGEPLVVIKQNRSKPLVIVDADYFFKELVK